MATTSGTPKPKVSGYLGQFSWYTIYSEHHSTLNIYDDSIAAIYTMKFGRLTMHSVLLKNYAGPGILVYDEDDLNPTILAELKTAVVQWILEGNTLDQTN